MSFFQHPLVRRTTHQRMSFFQHPLVRAKSKSYWTVQCEEESEDQRLSPRRPYRSEDLRPLFAPELSAVCSNLARDCEKQYHAEQTAAFTRLADCIMAEDLETHYSRFALFLLTYDSIPGSGNCALSGFTGCRSWKGIPFSSSCRRKLLMIRSSRKV